MSCQRHEDVGAYLLGALGDDEAATFAAHLPECSACRPAVAGLQPVVDTLPMATPQIAPPPELKGRIMAIVEAEAELMRASGPHADEPPRRPRRRWFWPFGATLAVRPAIAASVACVLLALGVAGGLLAGRVDEGTPTHVFPAKVTIAGARASLAVTGSRAALRVQGMPSPPRGKMYQVWFLRGKGAPIPTHTLFNVRSDGRATVQIEESVQGVDSVLVSAEPDGGSTKPTSAPVIAVART